MKRFLQIIDKPQMYRTAVTLGALLPIALGLGWIFTFAFTDYRPDLSRLGLPLGIATLIFGLCLFFLYRWAVFLSIVLALTATIACLAFVFSGAWTYLFVATLPLLYAIVTGRHQFLQWNYFRSQRVKS